MVEDFSDFLDSLARSTCPWNIWQLFPDILYKRSQEVKYIYIVKATSNNNKEYFE